MADKPPAPAPISTGITANIGEIFFLFIIIALLSGVIGIGMSFVSGDSSVGIVGFFKDLYDTILTVSTVLTMIAVVIAIYSYMRIGEIAEAETKKLGLALNWNSERKQKNERWERVETYMTSLNPSDWKIAILEADNILDQVVERMGYQGSTLGERMKNIEASDFPYLDDAWVAHKARNSIAHKGTDYELSRSDAEQTINIYHRVFKELGYL